MNGSLPFELLGLCVERVGGWEGVGRGGGGELLTAALTK